MPVLRLKTFLSHLRVQPCKAAAATQIWTYPRPLHPRNQPPLTPPSTPARGLMKERRERTSSQIATAIYHVA